MDIKSFNLHKETEQYLESKRFSGFLPVQSKTIPILLNRDSSFIEAPTGTGKTLAFIIPILQRLDFSLNSTQAIIITPTRELAIQIKNVLKEMKEFFSREIKSTLAIGGQDFDDQLRKLNNGTQIIIGTIHRINSLRKESNHPLTELKYLIVDEVDMVLNFGGFEDIGVLSKDVSHSTTLGFFSASFPIEVQNYIKKFFKRRITNIIIKEKDDAILISHFIKAFDNNKMKALLNLISLDTFNPYFCLIFAKTNEDVIYLHKELRANNVRELGFFHSGLSQRERNRLLKSMNNSELVYLVTTDLMARGMDFPGVTHIVNYSLPVDLIYYKHRIGRTNRNSVKGNIYDIYIDGEIERYQEVSKKNPNIVFEKMKV